MAISTLIISLFLIFAVALATEVSLKVSPSLTRLINGRPVDTIRRFPHHVSIHTTHYDGVQYNCSGSILSDQWILSSISCVFGAVSLRLDFERLFAQNSKGSFSLTIDNSSVYLYPTEYDDIALIKIPVKLQFSATLKSVDLFAGYESFENKLAVMAGFGDNSSTLSYGMFRVISADECKKFYGDSFDEYLQICTKGWNNNNQVPCEGNEGGGLIFHWPNRPQLIGVFSGPLNCSSTAPAFYTKVSEYIPWIIDTTENFGNWGEV